MEGLFDKLERKLLRKVGAVSKSKDAQADMKAMETFNKTLAETQEASEEEEKVRTAFIALSEKDSDSRQPSEVPARRRRGRRSQRVSETEGDGSLLRPIL